MKSKETWTEVIGYEGLYEVSDLGMIRSITRRVTGKLNSTRTIPSIIRKPSNVRGYAYIRLCKGGIQMTFPVHRIVMASFEGPSDLFVDHINGDKMDNRLSNLRYCTHRENVIFAATDRPRRKSKYIGVTKTKYAWNARICTNGKNRHIGNFKTEIEAHKAYQSILKKIMP